MTAPGFRRWLQTAFRGKATGAHWRNERGQWFVAVQAVPIRATAVQFGPARSRGELARLIEHSLCFAAAMGLQSIFESFEPQLLTRAQKAEITERAAHERALIVLSGHELPALLLDLDRTALAAGLRP